MGLKLLELLGFCARMAANRTAVGCEADNAVYRKRGGTGMGRTFCVLWFLVTIQQTGVGTNPSQQLNLSLAVPRLSASHQQAVASDQGCVEFSWWYPPLAAPGQPLLNPLYTDRAGYTNVDFLFWGGGSIRNRLSVAEIVGGKARPLGGFGVDPNGLRLFLPIVLKSGEHTFSVTVAFPKSKPNQLTLDPFTVNIERGKLTSVLLQVRQIDKSMATTSALFGLLKTHELEGITVGTRQQIGPAIPTTATVQDVTDLSELLAASEWTSRWNAVQALAKAGDARSVELLTKALQDEVTEVGMSGARYLIKMSPERRPSSANQAIRDFLFAALKNPDWYVRLMVLPLFPDFGDKSAVDILRQFKMNPMDGVSPLTGRFGGLGDRVLSKEGMVRKALNGAADDAIKRLSR